MTFIELLKSEQEKRALNQSQFSELIGVTARTLYNWQEGTSEPNEITRTSVLEKLAGKSENPNKTDLDQQITLLFKDLEDTIRSPYTNFCATCTAPLTRLINNLRDQILTLK